MEAQAVPVCNPFQAAEQAFGALQRQLTAGESMEMTHSELETFIGDEGRELLRLLLQGHFTLRGQRKVKEAVVGADDIPRTHVRPRVRGLQTVFGHVEIERECFGQRGVDSLSPVDAELNLPDESYSLGLRKRAAFEVAKGSFDDAVLTLKHATGVGVPKRQVEELAVRAADDFDAFYEERELAANEGNGEILVVTTDGKGISMRREDLRPATRKAAEQRQPKRLKRRSKGEKSSTRRMAQVAAVYTITPNVRTAEDIVGELHRGPQAPEPVAPQKRPRPERKRVWASVSQDSALVVADAFAEAGRRDPMRVKQAVVLVDGQAHQLATVIACARDAGFAVTIIIDIIHVIEYLWGAANALCGEGTPEGEQWTTERLDKILRGKSSDVAAGMRRSATKRDLTEAQRAPVDRCAGYLLKLGKYLRYDEYLAAGYPIATGVIEGACRHLVKDRMDITGARWSLQGAEAVLRLRALKASGDFDEYWDFHETKHLERTHLEHYAANIAPRTHKPPQLRRKAALHAVP